MNTKRLRISVLAAAIAAALPMTALGADDITTLKQEVQILKQELAKLRTAVQNQNQKAVSKEDVKAIQTQLSEVAEGQSNLTMDNASIVHLGGYGHVGYSDQKNSNDAFGEVGFNPIFHYQYKDLLMFEAEMELKVLGTGEADVGLEYANMNLFVNDYITAFGGKFLSPLGYFIQNLHPAWVNKFPSKPAGFDEGGGAIPVSAVGAGLKGGVPLGSSMKAVYAAYVGNGPRLTLDGAGTAIETIDALGATVSPSNRLIFGGRLGLIPIPRLEIGVSGATSEVAVAAGDPRRSYYMLGADAGYTWKGLSLRGEYLQQTVGDEATSVAPQGGTWKTHYLQASYRVPATKWESVVRYSNYTSPNADQSKRQWGVGLDYWFAPSIVGKVAYEFNDGLAGTPNDENRLLLQFGYGF